MYAIHRATPSEPDVAVLIARHFNQMRSQSPEESCHVFTADALAAPDVRLFALRDGAEAVAIGAIRIDGIFGELKSMHTSAEMRGRGFGRKMLEALVKEARALGISRLSLETGSGPEHAAARGLYTSAGFAECPPFGDYKQDPLSCFMTKDLLS